MTKKAEKNSEIERREVAIQAVYSNEFGIGYGDTDIVLNFFFTTPHYLEPHNDLKVPVARIILPWESAENIMKSLKEIVKEHKKQRQNIRNQEARK